LGPAIAWNWQQRGATAARFLLAWALPFWIALELVPTKLPNYLLPAYPALALAVGGALVAASEGKLASWRWLDRSGLFLWVVATLALAAALLVAPILYCGGLLPAGVAGATIAVGAGAYLLTKSWRGAKLELGLGVPILAFLVLALGFGFVAPQLDRLWLSRSAARLVADYGPPKNVPIAATGYAEPSLVFMLGTKTLLPAADNAAAHLTTARGALALVESEEDAAFRAGLAARGWAPREIGKVSGIDYSNGRAMILTLYAGVPR